MKERVGPNKDSLKVQHKQYILDEIKVYFWTKQFQIIFNYFI